MPQVSEAARRETLWVTAWTAGLCAVMHLVFALLKRWDLTVLWGSLLGFAAAVGTFFWLAMTVQKAVGKPEKDARRILQASQMERLLVQAGVLALAFAVPGINGFAAMIPLFFPQIAVRLRPLWKKGLQSDPDETQDGGETLD